MSKTSANVSIIDLADGRQVCLSYGVIVAAFIPRDYAMAHVRIVDWSQTCSAEECKRFPNRCDHVPVCGYVRTDARYSVTTSRHMNQFAGEDSPIIPHADLLALCAPITSKQ